jgi:hypothetical protein
LTRRLRGKNHANLDPHREFLEEATVGAIIFFDETGGKGSPAGVWTQDINPTIVYFKDDPGFRNDAAKSLVIVDMPQGTTIEVYDDPEGSRGDDWTEINAREPIRQYIVRSFEEDVDSDSIAVVYHRRNGLNGKVSRAVITTEIGTIEQGLSTDRAET